MASVVEVSLKFQFIENWSNLVNYTLLVESVERKWLFPIWQFVIDIRNSKSLSTSFKKVIYLQKKSVFLNCSQFKNSSSKLAKFFKSHVEVLLANNFNTQKKVWTLNMSFFFPSWRYFNKKVSFRFLKNTLKHVKLLELKIIQVWWKCKQEIFAKRQKSNILKIYFVCAWSKAE